MFGLTCVCIYVIFWLYIYFKNNLKWRLSNSKTLLTSLNENIYYTLSSVSGYLSISSSLIILSIFVNDTELGKFSVAQKVALLLRTIPVLITQSILQEATRKAKENKTNFYKFKDPHNLEKITRIFFSHRRKMIKKPLNQIFSNNIEIINKLNIDQNLRPQNLDFETYYKLTSEYEKLRS